ncbi:hypothetical protein B0H34DRAFT_720258 [Crassisporium funariophilum]|nr:hypothetical protein B0H34DRAFT_720258 [Crassisporium funariophilum]
MDSTHEQLSEVLVGMTNSLSAARATLQSFKQDPQNLDMKNGISLLSLKHHVLLSYLHSLVLVSANRIVGSSLTDRSPPSQPFSTKDRDARGNQSGDLIDSMIENRVVLEKVDALEGKMRYQIEKLIRIADGPSQTSEVTEDPLAFRPNPSSFVQNDSAAAQEASGSRGLQNASTKASEDGIYHPPRMAPVPYVEKSKNQARRDRPPIPSALSTLSGDPSRPFVESTSGLGGIPALASGRAQYLKRLKDFEEDNFTRVIMKKSDAKRRARDEEDLALGGDLGSGSGPRGRRTAGGLADEFSEVLRSVSRVSGGRGQGDGYEELRQRGKKRDVLERSRTGSKHDAFDDNDVSDNMRTKKRSRFELDTKIAKKKLKR